MRPRRASIRVRLTAWYSAIFFLLGAVLLTASYAVVRHEFDRSDRTVQVRVDAPATAATPSRVLRVRIARASRRSTARRSGSSPRASAPRTRRRGPPTSPPTTAPTRGACAASSWPSSGCSSC